MYRFLFACYISFHLLNVSGSLLSSWRGDSTFGLSVRRLKEENIAGQIISHHKETKNG